MFEDQSLPTDLCEWKALVGHMKFEPHFCGISIGRCWSNHGRCLYSIEATRCKVYYSAPDPIGTRAWRRKRCLVISTSAGTAIKIFNQFDTFQREWACYLRLQETAVFEILGHHVPQLIAADECLWIVEMTIVQSPFILDFASAYLDVPPDFPNEVMAQWQHAKREEFEANWGSVVIILHVLEEKFGIYLLDVHPGNITFGENIR